MANDFFSKQLLGCEWRGKSFPCTSFQVRLHQSIVSHERPDQDGARVESTGRKPLSFVAHIPFRNSISKGPNESFGVLYPDGHRAFLADMANRTAGTLQHPSLGLILCKPVSCESSLASGVRDGEDVTAEWIETRDEDDVLGNVFQQDSPITSAVLTASDLDDGIALTNLGGFDPDRGAPSFEDAMRTVQASFDKSALLSKRAFGLIGRVAYRIDVLLRTIDAQRDPQNWATRALLEKLAESIRHIKSDAGKQSRDVRFYITPGVTTLGALAAKLANKPADMIALNPQLVSAPSVPADTPVRYYAPNTN